MKEKRFPAVLIVCLLAFLLTAGCGALYLVWNFTSLIPRVGSVTPNAKVYAFPLGNMTGYRYVLYRDDEIVYRSIVEDVPPYIFEHDGIFVISQGDGYTNAETYDPKNDSWGSERVTGFLNPFAKTQHLITKPVYAGESNCACAWDISAGDGGLWYWAVNDTQGELIWDGTSETPPEFEGDDTFLTVYYTEEGQEFCYEFAPESGWRSYDYALYENRTVYVEQLTDFFTLYYMEFPESARTTGFVNTEPTELTDCNSAYFRAKAEVSIPYDLVTFRFELHGYDIENWEVTFSQKDDPEGAAQTVYMTGDGVTICVLDGRGTAL